MANYLYQYRLKEGKTVEGAVKYVIRYLRNEQMEVQTFENDDGVVVQARSKNAGMKKLVGMDRAATIQFTCEDGVLVVEMGQSKWADKVAGYVVSWILFWPAAITATIGIAKQKELFDQIKRVVEQYTETFSVVLG